MVSQNAIISVKGRTKPLAALVFLHNRWANKSHLLNTGLLLAHRLWRWPNLKLVALDQHLVFAGYVVRCGGKLCRLPAHSKHLVSHVMMYTCSIGFTHVAPAMIGNSHAP